LLLKPSKKLSEFIPNSPDYDKKIKFNSLSQVVAELLNAGRRQSFVISEYFELNSKFVKDDLRQIFQELYDEALKIIPESDTKNDEVFQYIVDKSSPINSTAVFNSVIVLMAYYFEYCDIFKIPE